MPLTTLGLPIITLIANSSLFFIAVSLTIMDHPSDKFNLAGIDTDLVFRSLKIDGFISSVLYQWRFHY